MTMPPDLITKLLERGSVAALAHEVGDDVAAAVMHELTQRTPEELQPSWPMVIAYGRMQEAYDVASRLGRTDDMLKAAAAQAKLLREVY